jgi:ABC-type uncharacterized transport system substrate-binding protein
MGANMRRRDFLGVLGGAAAAWPLVTRAQQMSLPVIGYISGATFDFMREYVNAFHVGLGSSGYVSDVNVLVEYRWAEGRNDRLPALIAELIQRRVDIIAVGGSTPGALAAKAANRHDIPTVYAYAEFTEAGGLMSYGTDNFDAHRKVGASTGRVLKGELPANLPVEQITKVEMVINLKTANKLGIAFPLAMLGRADKVIE